MKNNNWLKTIHAIVGVFLLMAAGRCQAEDAFVYPIDLATDKEGLIYVADLKLPGLWCVNTAGSDTVAVDVVMQGQNRFGTPLNAIRCVTLDSEQIVFVADSATREIYRCDAEWNLKPLTGGRIGIPLDLIAIGGDLIVADAEKQAIWKVSKNGGEPQKLAQIDGIRGLAAGQKNREFVCLLSRGNPLRRLTSEGILTEISSNLTLEFPLQILKHKSNYFVLDGYAATVWQIKMNGNNVVSTHIAARGNMLRKPVSIAMCGEELLILDAEVKKLFRISEGGEIKDFSYSQKN